MMRAPGMMMGGYPGYGLGPVWRLNLSPAQRQQLSGIEGRLSQQQSQLAGRMAEDHARLRSLYASPAPNPESVGAVYGDLGRVRQQMAENHVRAMNAARSLLYPQQRAQLDQWRSQWYGGGQWRGAPMVQPAPSGAPPMR